MNLVPTPDLPEARELLRDVVRPTPLEESRWLSRLVGGPAYLKCENLQRAGSFKIRGAYVRIAKLSDEAKAKGVVAASAGNHAQGVALAAHMLGTHATIFMPEAASLVKENATRAYGADVRFAGTKVDQALLAARAFAAETGAEFIHPFDHEDIIAGQATVGMEILEQLPEVRTIVVGLGGGGLASGVALASAKINPDIRVVGVQAKGAAAYPESLRRGEPTALEHMSTMADGIAVGSPGELTFEVVRKYVESVTTVSEDLLSRALVLLLERAKLVVEPAGAASVAALLDHPELYEPPVVAVLSGGNIDPLLMMRVVRHGMAAAGRYLSMRVKVPDAPGGLARLLGELAAVNVNVLDVVHERTSAELAIGEAEILLRMETRGSDHRERVLAKIREAGYHVTVPGSEIPQVG